MIWVNEETMGADIGSDDNFRKVNSMGVCLIDRDTNSGGTREFALDSSHQIMIRAWPIVLSTWNVNNIDRNVHWE
jgi:hypothetical protein